MSIWSPTKYGWGVVYWLRIEGVPVDWIERETTQTLPAGFSQDASLVIDRSSEVGQLVDRDTGLGTGFPLTFHLLDTTTVRTWLKRWAYSAELTVDATPSAATLTVSSAQNWPASGTLWLGIERITYTGTTTAGGVTTSFTGCTRGTGGSLKTAHYASTHGGKCTDLPRWWRGRQVRLFASPVDPAGYMTGTALEDECEEVWRGTIDDGPARVGNLWEFNAQSLDRLLARPLVAPVVGRIVDTSAKYPIKKADEFVCDISGWTGLTAAATMTWGFSVVVRPFEALTDNALLTTAEQASLFVTAWTAAVAAAVNKVGGASNGATYLGAFKFFQAPADVKAGGQNNTKVYTAYYKGTWFFSLRLLSDAGTLKVTATSKVNGKPFAAPDGGDTWTDPYAQDGWHTLSINSAGHLLSDPVKFGAVPSSLGGITVELDNPADAVPTTGSLVVKGGPTLAYTLSDVTTPGVAYFGGISGKAIEPGKLAGQSVEVRFSASGAFALVMRRLLVSSGTAALRNATYDMLAYGQGYSLDANGAADVAAVDIDSFGKLANGPMVDLQASVNGAGESFADLFGGICGLANRAVVSRADNGTTGGGRRVRIGMVSTESGGSDYGITITDADLLTSEGEPVALIRRRDVPNTIVVQLLQGADEGDKYIARDAPAVAEQGAIEVTFNLPISAKTISDKVAQWTSSRLAASQTLQAVELQCVPWVGDVEVGDLVRLVLTHYAVWQWSTGTPGYTGQGRVLGVRRRLTDGALTVTVLIDGSTNTRSLSPAAQVSAFAGPAAAPTTIDIPQRFYTHAAKTLSEAAGNIRLDHYQPGGGAESGGGYYTISAASDTGAVCRLTVAAVGGGAVLSTAAASTLTLPATANASTYQAGFAHTLDGSSWV